MLSCEGDLLILQLLLTTTTLKLHWLSAEAGITAVELCVVFAQGTTVKAAKKLVTTVPGLFANRSVALALVADNRNVADGLRTTGIPLIHHRNLWARWRRVTAWAAATAAAAIVIVVVVVVVQMLPRSWYEQQSYNKITCNGSTTVTGVAVAVLRQTAEPGRPPATCSSPARCWSLLLLLRLRPAVAYRHWRAAVWICRKQCWLSPIVFSPFRQFRINAVVKH